MTHLIHFLIHLGLILRFLLILRLIVILPAAIQTFSQGAALLGVDSNRKLARAPRNTVRGNPYYTVVVFCCGATLPAVGLYKTNLPATGSSKSYASCRLPPALSQFKNKYSTGSNGSKFAIHNPSCQLSTIGFTQKAGH